MVNLSGIDATEQAALVKRGECSPVELIDAAVERIERIDPQVNSVVIRLFERARAEAADVDVRESLLPGVPVVVKDSVATQGDPWHRGMRLLRDLDHRAPFEAFAVSQMRRAGGAIVGKANVGELEGGITVEPVSYGPTRNPWNLDLSVGGSSGGPAAAVAAGLVPIGIGVDGGGSVRVPASICGLVGLKVSRGRASLAPQYIEDGASTVGLLTRTVRDAALGLDAIAGSPHGDHFALPPRERAFTEEVGAEPGRLRVGLWSPTPTSPEVHADCKDALAHAATLLEAAGHDLDTSHPAELDTDFFHQPGFVIAAATHIRYQVLQLAEELGRPITAEDVELVTWACMMATEGLSSTDLQRAYDGNRQAAVRYGAWWDQGYDLLLTPTLAVPPYPLGALNPTSPDQPWPDVSAWIPFTPHANLAGLPAISLPLSWNADGLPIGVQLVARFGREDLLLRVAAQLEAADPWAGRVPPVFA